MALILSTSSDGVYIYTKFGRSIAYGLRVKQ